MLFSWLFSEPPSPAAQEIAEEFRVGKITHSDLDRHGICELGIHYLGEPVHISWYPPFLGPHSRLRSLSINGRNLFGSKSEARLILRAAIERANRTFDDELQRINRKRTSE